MTDREEGTDGGEGSRSNPPVEQQGGRGDSQEGSSASASTTGSAGTGTRAGASTTQGNGTRRTHQPAGNIRFVNFPVRVQMVRGGGGGGRQAEGTSQAGATAGPGAGPAGSNPQVPQFGAPMFFNLPML